MSPVKQLILLLSLSAAAMPHFTYGQGLFVDPREADNDFRSGNYFDALKVYKKLIEQEPGNIVYHYRAGLCYLNTNINKSKAIDYFEWITKRPKFDNEVWYALGVAYHYSYRFEDAINAFNRYKQNAANGNKAKADKQIEECRNAEILIKNPLDVTVTNLGNNINSAYPDYYPLVSVDESAILFTTRRPNNNAMHTEMDGYYSSDIYISQAVNGQWQKAKSVGEQINTTKDEEATGLNPSGNTMVFYVDNIKHDGKIYYSVKKGKTFSKAISFPDNINEGFQSAGYITEDGNILFFASERAGGYGGTDIYMARKLPNGNWANPQNLGTNINTPYNEDFPRLDADSNVLYFSSQGHNTMGNYDLFESSWLNPAANKWGPARNLGYPINTPGDDRCISFTKDHHAAYISAVRPGGKGDVDIYRVVFNNVPRLTVISGQITGSDNSKPTDALITTTNILTKESLYFKPVKSGRYVMILAPGTYNLQIDCKGYNTYKEAFTIFDLGSFRNQVVKNYALTPAYMGLENGQKNFPLTNRQP